MSDILTIVRNSQDQDLIPSFFSDFETYLAEKTSIIKQRILCDNIAKEYEISGLDANLLAGLNDYLDSQKVDFYLRSKEQYLQKKKLYITDMDSTLIENECIDEMADMIGKGEEIKNITKAAMEGELLFEASLEKRVKALKGMEVSLLAKIQNQVIRLSKGAETLCKTLKKHGFTLVIVSGGFVQFTRDLREKLNFDYDFANLLEEENGKLTGNLIPPIFGPEDKLTALKQIMSEKNIKKNEVIGIGDGANDLTFLSYIDNGFAYKAKKVVKEGASFQIEHTDLTSILYFLGFEQRDFL